MIGVLLALAAAATWGASEFFGGLQSKTNRVLTVLLFSSVAALGFGFLLLPIMRNPMPDITQIWQAIPAGILSVIALGFIYKAVAIGPAIVVLPTAACATVIPIFWGFLTGDKVSFLALMACVVALISSLFASGITEFKRLDVTARKNLSRPFPYALVASVFFGCLFYFF